MNFIKKLFRPKCKVCKRRFNTKRGLSVHKTVAHKQLADLVYEDVRVMDA